MLKRVLSAYGAAIAAGVLLHTSPVLAKDSSDILAQVDDALTNAKDQAMEFELVTQEPGKAARNMVFKVFVKGREWRRIDFVAPGDVKGMRILVRSADNMYVYLPAYRKVRRVASHVKEQGFMGTAFSHDEMSLVTFGPTFTSKLVEEGDKFWKLALTRKEGSEFPYAKLNLEVRKDLKQPVEIQYFNEDGVKVKTEVRLGFKCQEGLCAPSVIKMTDHTRNNLVSELKMRKWSPDSGLGEIGRAHV